MASRSRREFPGLLHLGPQPRQARCFVAGAAAGGEVGDVGDVGDVLEPGRVLGSGMGV